MESYSHSQSQRFKPQSTSIPPTFSTNGNKKPPTFPINNGGFFSTSYDDVFGGPPKYSTLAPRAEDYSEIFGAFRTPSSSRASSIPVLDLPPVSDIISGGSVFDYSDVFADFDPVGFAVSYDQLFPPFDAGGGDGDGDGCSSDEAWTPVGTESLSDDSDPFASLEKSQCFTNENSRQPLDNKQFSVSYHKVNVGTSTCIPNMTHVAQLNAVPGYTCVFEETSSPREMGVERLSTEEVDDIVFSVDSSSILPEKHERKTMSEMSLDDAGVKSSDGDHVLVGARATSMSHVDSTVASVSDINLATESLQFPPLSRLPPVATERKEAISRSSGLISTDDCSLEVTHDNRLPPCFDMEVDANSFASASAAAAMKDAMEKAQAKLKGANVLMDRKKDGLQDIADLGLKTDGNGGNNVQTAFNECAYGDNRLQTESGRGPAKMMSSQSLPDMSAVEQPNFVIEKPAEGKHEKKCSLSMNTAFNEGDGEWKKATQYYEFVTCDSSRVVPKPPSNVDGKISSSIQQSDDDHNSDSDGEVCVPEGNRPRLKTIKSVSRQEYYEKMFKVAQEVHDSVIGGYVNYDHRPTGMLQGNHEEQKRKLGYESEKNAAIKTGRVQQVQKKNLGEPTSNEELKIKSKNELGNKEINMKGSKKKETEACHPEQSDQKTYGLDQGRVKESPEIKEEKRRMKELYERVESCCSVEEIVGGAENEKKTPEAYEKPRIKNKLADAVKQKKGKEQRDVKEKRSKEPFENGFGGKGLQTASESQETGKTKDLKREVEDERSKRAFVDVFGEERLERTCEFRENDNKIDLLFRNEDGIFVEVAVDGQGSERIQEECIEMGKHWKYEDAPEQLIGRQRHRQNECHKPASGNKKSGEGLHQDNNEEKLKKLTEHGGRDKPMQVDEMDEVVKVLKKTGVAENQKFVSGSHVIIEWEDEDQGSERSSEMELLVENECLKPSGRTNLHERNVKVEPNALTSKFKSPRTEADGGQYVCAHKQNGEVSDVACNKQSNLKAVDTADVLVDEKPTESFAAEMGVVDHKDERTVHVVHSFDRNDSNSKSGELCNRNRQQLKNKNEKVAQPVPNPVLVKDSDIEQAGRRNLGDGHVLSDQKQKVKSTPAEGISRWNEDERAKNKEADQVVMTKWKENIQKKSHLPNVSQSTEQKGKISDQNCSLDEKIENKEKDFKKEQLRKLEEERERQREREKDRMAVEIAIREARERAFADARDQVERNALERSADEARQRMMNEARERLEKACAEARERSLADKASEARLRADRVAVERATAEARQRAIEKAMAERATFEARERMQRSISEKYMSERDVVTRQSSMPSMHSEEFEAGDGEPAQRCKARLERHRRTVERVAKALAEKNMRDILAQKEQAERSRLAETLDADIKRWSNGKEGNLRALLSTLQYILGPDSGWQPIPLTEVITAAAVKRAYRKATLCVHPDKLQQRGASIQHKYICEKVFDLLKEAWNRFNSEEK